MTNEEAREVINREIDKAIVDETYMTEEIYDALCVASKSIALQILESQPCEDAISREEVNDLVDELIRTISDEINYRPRNRSSLAIMHDISNLPSVKPQPKIDEIIKRIEETRDKDQIAEYPYNRCIKIIREVLGDD